MEHPHGAVGPHDRRASPGRHRRSDTDLVLWAQLDFGAMRLDETDRLEAFSDGVMAVIITIMAFNVKPPNGASLSATHAVLPELLVYMLSFAMIGIYWNNHHHLLRSTDRMDGSVMWSNLFLLFWLSLVPVVTGWVGRYPNHALPAATYGIVALGSALAYSILVRFIIRANGFHCRPCCRERFQGKPLGGPLYLGGRSGVRDPDCVLRALRCRRRHVVSSRSTVRSAFRG